MECKVTNDMLSMLSQSFMEEEVTKVLFQMHPCKVPGPDGMSATFIHKLWSIVGPSVVESYHMCLIMVQMCLIMVGVLLVISLR